MSNVKTPPQAPEMERALLGALLSDGAAIIRVTNIVVPASFYNPNHRTLYKVMVDIFERGDPVDLVTVCDKLRANNKLAEIGGVPFLADLASEVPTSSNIEHYANMVQEKFILRNVIALSATAVTSANDPAARAEGVVSKILENLSKLQVGYNEKKPVSSLEAVKSTLARIEYTKSKKYTGGVQTGLDRVDKIIVEFEPGELIVIAARPSIGKTVLGQNIAEHNAAKGTPGMFFSLEMGNDPIVMRTLSRHSDTPLHVLRSREPLSKWQQEKIHKSSAIVAEWPIVYDENKYESAQQITNAIRAEMMRTPLKYVVIDQLSKIKPISIFRDNEYRMHLNCVISGLKEAAGKLGIVVILLHQISREVKNNKDRRPSVDDLKDTGAVEEDADGVILIHRPEYYSDLKLKKLWIAGVDYEVQGHAEIIVAKRRQGATGCAAVGFNGNLTKFHNLAQTQAEASWNPAPDNDVPQPEFTPGDDLPF